MATIYKRSYILSKLSVLNFSSNVKDYYYCSEYIIFICVPLVNVL